MASPVPSPLLRITCSAVVVSAPFQLFWWGEVGAGRFCWLHSRCTFHSKLLISLPLF